VEAVVVSYRFECCLSRATKAPATLGQRGGSTASAIGRDRRGRPRGAAGIGSSAVGYVRRLLGTISGRRRRKVDIRVGVHRGLAGPHRADAYVITVLNLSPERSVTIAHVWLEAVVKMPVLTRRLPVTVAAGEQWETWIEARELPPGTTDVEHRVRVVLDDDTVIALASRGAVSPTGVGG
jgi:hypothetical protein